MRHDNSGFFPSWLLDRVIVTDKEDKYEFICQKWFSTKRDDGKIDRIIKEKNYAKFSEMRRKYPHPYKIIKKKKKDKKKEKTSEKFKYYYVKIYTGGSQDLAGTDLNAEIKMFGDNCVSKYFKLNETKTHKLKFERNQVE